MGLIGAIPTERRKTSSHVLGDFGRKRSGQAQEEDEGLVVMEGAFPGPRASRSHLQCRATTAGPGGSLPSAHQALCHKEGSWAPLGAFSWLLTRAGLSRPRSSRGFLLPLVGRWERAGPGGFWPQSPAPRQAQGQSRGAGAGAATNGSESILPWERLQPGGCSKALTSHRNT